MSVTQMYTLRGEALTRRVWLDEVELLPGKSQKVRNHSPDGFNWGYGGSGPAQLALAVILKLTSQSGNYQSFKWAVISRLPVGEDFHIEFTLPKDYSDCQYRDINDKVSLSIEGQALEGVKKVKMRHPDF